MWGLPAAAGDWPTYLHDAGRSGVTEESLTFPLSLQWMHAPTYPPEPAWQDPQPKPVEGILELPRLRFDDAFHVAVSSDLVVFGSSSDLTVRALDARTGDQRWVFFTEGPVRFAPTVSDGRVFAGSDDGHVYCLDLETGRELWRFRAGPSPAKILGNGRMISLWPVRTGVLVDGGTAYFGAGVFPAEGLYLYALSVGDGSVKWCNDSYGRGGIANITPQGYLLFSDSRVFVPSGRAVPGVFERSTGRFLYQRNPSRFAVGTVGGTAASLAGDVLINGTEKLMLYRESNQALIGVEFGRLAAVTDTQAFVLDGEFLSAYPRDAWVSTCTQRLGPWKRILQLDPQVSRKRAERNRLVSRQQPVPAQLTAEIERLAQELAQVKAADEGLVNALRGTGAWRVPCAATESLVVAGNAVVAGDQEGVRAFALSSGESLYEDRGIQQAVRGLAVSNGRLFLSVADGRIVCLGSGSPERPFIAERRINLRKSSPQDASGGALVRALSRKQGYAVLFGGDVSLAASLEWQSELRIHVVSTDTAGVAASRSALDRKGLYGGRVVAFVVESLGELPFSDFYANLVVVREEDVEDDATMREAARLVKPFGGVLAVPSGAALPDGVLRRLEASGFSGEDAGVWTLWRRGALPGSGEWTHEYADAGNTAASHDGLVKGDLGILWYGAPGPTRMPSRHASAAAPVALQGCFVVQVENAVVAYDAYNGVKLWERPLQGVPRLGLKTRASNLVADGSSVYVVARGVCHRLDVFSGKPLGTYAPSPSADGQARDWGEYISVDHGCLYGSTGPNTVFAVDVASGNTLWEMEAGALMPATIAVHNGAMFFVDRRVTPEQEQAALAEVEPDQRVDRYGKAIPADVRLITALEAATGEVRWERPHYVSDCVKVGSAGGELTLMAAHGVVLLCGQPWNGHFWQEFFAGEFSRRSLIALSAEDGRVLWSGRKGYRSRPLIVEDMVVAEPWAYDLRTGADRTRIHALTGYESRWQFSRPGHHCGNIAGCTNALFFRSGSAAYYDLSGDYGTAHFGGQRSGCWINCIPANGVVMMPEASSGCVCPYPLHCTTVFSPRRHPCVWGMYSAAGEDLPVRGMRLNFGAPGDRSDADGALWLGFPRPQRTRLVLDLKVQAQLASGGSFYSDEASVAGGFAGELAWLAGSGARGLRECRIPLLADGDGAARYLVRLHVSPPSNPGAAPFSVTIQGEPVAREVVLTPPEDGSGVPLVLEYAGIRVDDEIRIAIQPSGEDPAAIDWPVVHGVEVLREEVLQVGMRGAPVVLNDAHMAETCTVWLANHKSAPFQGLLTASVPAGFTASPASIEVSLGPGERAEEAFSMARSVRGEPVRGTVDLALAAGDGRAENGVEVPLEYLGPRGRLVIEAEADSYVNKGNPTAVNGRHATFAVDGGAAKMGDHSHNVAYLRFPLGALPGQPLSATLRLYVPEGGHTHSSDSGRLRLVEGEWDESTLNGANAPEPGPEIGVLGRVEQGRWEERPLTVDLSGRRDISIAIDPTSCDGATYVSREGLQKPQLVVEYRLVDAP
jgi:outer membrane protein assembly factor BamB